MGTMRYRSHLAELKTPLSAHQLEVLNSEMVRLHKSALTAYALWLVLSWFGVHHFYLERPWKAIAYILAFTVGVAGLVLGFLLSWVMDETWSLAFRGAAVGGGLVLAGWWFVDLVTLHKQVERYNEEMEAQVIEALREPGGPPRPEQRSRPRPLYLNN